MRIHSLTMIGLGILFQGCVIVNTPGFHSGYKKLPSAEQAKIQFVPPNQAIPAANGRTIYAVGAQSLLTAMQRNDSTLVYVWSPLTMIGLGILFQGCVIVNT